MTLMAVVPLNAGARDARLIFASFVWRIADVANLVMKNVALTLSSAPKTSIQGSCTFLHLKSKPTTSAVENLPLSNTSFSIVAIKANVRQ